MRKTEEEKGRHGASITTGRKNGRFGEIKDFDGSAAIRRTVIVLATK